MIIDEHDFCNVPRQNKRNIINWKIVYSTLQTVNFRKNNSFPFNNFPLHFSIFLFACSPFSFPYSLFPINYFPILISQSPVPVLITSFLAVQFRKEKLVSWSLPNLACASKKFCTQKWQKSVCCTRVGSLSLFEFCENSISLSLKVRRRKLFFR